MLIIDNEGILLARYDKRVFKKMARVEAVSFYEKSLEIGGTSVTLAPAGGYQDLQKEQDVSRIGQELKQDELHTLQKDNLKLNTKHTERQFNTYWIPIGISLLAAGFAIASYYKPVPEPKNNDEQLKQIEQRMDYIQGTLHKEVDSLKNNLYEVEMMVRVLEDGT